MHPGIHAEATPDKPAVIMGTSGEVVTYRELNDRSNRFARLLHARGLRQGDHVAVFMENNSRFHEVVWGTQRSGLYLTTINSHLTAPEVEYIIGDCEAQVVIGSEALRPVVEEVTELLSDRVHSRLFIGDNPPDGWESYDAAVADHPAEALADEREGLFMLYSSGTTGRPKGIKHQIPDAPLGTVAHPVLAALRMLFGFTEDTIYLSPAPLYHSAPLAFSTAVTRVGGTVVVMERFDPIDAIKLIERHKVTASQWVPTMFVRMLKLDPSERTGYDLSSHQTAIHAAAPCPVPVKAQMIEWWGPIISEYYAGTEGNGFVYTDSTTWLAHPGTVGKPISGVIHIVGEDGEELAPGESGTIYFEGGTAFEYHNDPEKTAASRFGEGWSTLGDVGYVDEEGYLYLTDRKAYMIISGGVNIYPQEAENVLITHPKVVDCAVFGVPNDDFGEEVKAVVQPVDMADAGPALERELIAFCKEQLSAYKCPRSVDFDPELPRLPTGKLYKRLVRDRYWEGRESRIV